MASGRDTLSSSFDIRGALSAGKKQKAAAAGSNREKAGNELARFLEKPGLTREHAASAARAGTVVLRVEWLELFLAGGHYVPVATEIALSELWGVARKTVENWVGEAWRRLASMHAPERSEEIRAEMLARIRVVGDAALNRRREVVNMQGAVVSVSDPDCRTALQAVVEMATLMNIREQRWRGKVDLVALSDAQILEQLAQHGFKLDRNDPLVLTDGEEVEKKECGSE